MSVGTIGPTWSLMTAEDPNPFDQLADNDPEEPVDIEKLFAESSIDDVDSDSVWDDLEARVSKPIDAQPDASDISIVPTRSFCQDCPHLADPPDVRCTYDGTEIVDFPDMDHVRVKNCPIVEERGGVMTAKEAEFLD